jgi:hypothetical protein
MVASPRYMSGRLWPKNRKQMPALDALNFNLGPVIPAPLPIDASASL